MIRTTVLAATALLAPAPLAHGELIAYWHFNEFDPADAFEIEADRGEGLLTLGTEDWEWSTGSFTGTELNSYDDTPRGSDLTVRGDSNNGNHLTIGFSTSGFVDPVLSFATRRTSLGFDENTVSYSTDNENFTPLRAYTPPEGSYGLEAFDLSGAGLIDDQSTAYVRITFDGADDGNGNNRIDNLQINATPASVPEPSTWLVAAASLGALGLRSLRRHGSRAVLTR